MPEHQSGITTDHEASKISIFLADDHAIIRSGLKALLEADSRFTVIGEAADGLETLRLVEKLAPQILILDLSMSGLHGLEVARQLAARGLNTRVVVLSMHTSEDYVRRALINNVAAYVPKDSTLPTLVGAILAAAAGGHFLPPPLSEAAISAYITQAGSQIEDRYESLTNREREVLQLVAEGLTNAEVGKRLFISARTVESHRAHLMHKLLLKNETELVRYAFKKRLIPIDEPLTHHKSK